MALTADQLSYIIERKYPNIQPGVHFIVTNNLNEDSDAVIREWKTTDVPQLSKSEIQRLWTKLEDEYHGDPNRPDSLMFQDMNTPPAIEVNEDL